MIQSFVNALTGSPDTVCDWRVINDRVKGEQGRNIRGTLSQVLPELQSYNDQGWGVFICVNALNGQGRSLNNISHIRTHVVDIDDVLVSQESYNRAVSSDFPPHLAVQTSQGKYHLYWLVEPYQGNDFFTLQQKKLNQFYNGDKSIVDATRVMRVPGFYHCKKEPQLVKCWQIHNNVRYTFEQIAKQLHIVNVIEHFSTRKALGDDKLKAPSLEWLKFALNLLDPNDLTRDEWLPLTAAFKQAGWLLTTEQTLLVIWQQWCRIYSQNDDNENLKLWNSIKDSEVGWGRFERLTNVKAYINNSPEAPPVKTLKPVNVINTENPTVLPPVNPITEDELPDILDSFGKQKWFEKCHFIENEGKIFSPTGRFMNQTQFNGKYGGKDFLLKNTGGKMTDDAWKAALRSTDWSIPKVDHVRFLPHKKSFTVVSDDMGRKGLNIYIPAKIKTQQGDISRWLDFLNKIFNTPDDIKIFNDYVAHCIKYPGWKISWSVLIQSAKGVGKQMIGEVIKHCVGESYTYQPKAEELVSGVSRFNGWIKNKIMIIVDEIRVGDRYDLMNGLKTIITDRRIAVERKGIDQEMEDNVANWLFFSNFKDAFPIDEDERRYCIFFSRLQNSKQIEETGLDKQYFDKMYKWLEQEDGYKALAYWYLNYPIEKGSLAHRSPITSSYNDVIRIGRSPLRVVLDDKIEIAERGFKNGYVSLVAFTKSIAESSMRSIPAEHHLKAIIESKGYKELGYTLAPVIGEDLIKPSLIYGLKNLSINNYENAQM